VVIAIIDDGRNLECMDNVMIGGIDAAILKGANRGLVQTAQQALRRPAEANPTLFRCKVVYL